MALEGMFGSIFVLLAYLDPGTGSYLFQIMIATLIGLTISIKAYWNKIADTIQKLWKR